jgi:hypothetical protein
LERIQIQIKFKSRVKSDHGRLIRLRAQASKAVEILLLTEKKMNSKYVLAQLFAQNLEPDTFRPAQNLGYLPASIVTCGVVGGTFALCWMLAAGVGITTVVTGTTKR